MEDGSPFDDTQIGLATPSIAYKLYACYVILVVGGAGFVGSHVVRELQKEGREHLVLDGSNGDLRRPLAALRSSMPTFAIQIRCCGSFQSTQSTR